MALTRIRIPSGPSIIIERWVADTKQEMYDAFDLEVAYWSCEGYGTDLYDMRQNPTHFTWHAEFSRYTSCE